MGHPPLPRGPAGSDGAAAGAVCPEVLGEAGLPPKLSRIALGRQTAKPQPTRGGIRFYKGDANHPGAVVPVRLALPEGMGAGSCGSAVPGVPLPRPGPAL